jgi:peptidoglycan/LPS O-acetylase OafA/YrhL
MGMLRAALALAVLLSHLPVASVKFAGGGLAVQAFFIVSGFYMALVLSGKYADTRLFYTNRMLRIFPSYFVMLGIAAVIFFGFGASATATRSMFQLGYQDPAVALIMAFENLALVGQELLFWFKLSPEGLFVFDPTNAPPSETSPVAWQPLLVPQAWSLSMELMFYALAPFLVRLSWRWLVGMASASIALRLCGHLLPVDYGLWQGRFFPTALFLFILGMLAHRLLPVVAATPKAIGWIVCALTLAYIVMLPRLGLDPELSRWLTYALLAGAAPFIFNATQHVAFDRWIGDLSYPIYLTHLAVIGLVLTYSPPFGPWIAIGGSVALSAALLLLVEHPIDRWRQARVRRGVVADSVPPGRVVQTT